MVQSSLNVGAQLEEDGLLVGPSWKLWLLTQLFLSHLEGSPFLPQREHRPSLPIGLRTC